MDTINITTTQTVVCRDFVKSKLPQAVCSGYLLNKVYKHAVYVTRMCIGFCEPLAYADNEEAAWKKAAERILKQEKKK